MKQPENGGLAAWDFLRAEVQKHAAASCPSAQGLSLLTASPIYSQALQAKGVKVKELAAELVCAAQCTKARGGDSL